MKRSEETSITQLFTTGEVLALFSPLQELEPGLYLIHSFLEDWVVLRWLIDDEPAEQIVVTDREAVLPSTLLTFFMPVGLKIAPGAKRSLLH